MQTDGVSTGDAARPYYTIIVTGERPTTMNHERGKGNRWDSAKRTGTWRETAAWMARQARIPKMDRIAVVATPHYRNGRSPQDVGACAPAAKAMVDGLRDAGVIVNDTPAHFVELTFRPGVVTGHDGLRLDIYDLDGRDVFVHAGYHLVVPISGPVHKTLIERVGSAAPDRLATHASAILATHLEGDRS